jgi:DNA polymerase-3 subunit delta
MKVQPNQVSGILKNSAQLAGILVYGEDWGLVRDRALAAVRGVVGTEASPFRSTTLTREEHGRLRDEVGGLALGGGRRVIHVQDASDGLVAGLEKLHVRPEDTLLVLEAGELPARSKLRAYAERQASWGAIACYMSNSGRVASEIQTALAEASLSATPDALAFLAQELAGESITRRAELEKLTVFAAGSGTVDLEMAQLCCASSLETSLGSAVAAALSGRVAQCDALLDELQREGATGPGLLAVLSGQVQRLLKVRLLIDTGKTPEEACRSLAPPLYPRQAAAFLQDVERWRTTSLEALGRAIREADVACKRAASPDFAIAARLLSAAAARHARR